MITVQIDDQVSAKLAAMERALAKPERPMKAFGNYLQRRWVKAMKQAPPNSLQAAEPGDPPLRHTQDFSKTITPEVEDMGRTLRVGTWAVFGEILHEGGTINMKSKLLTVPVDPAAIGKRARDMNLRFIPLPGRGFTRGLLVDEAGDAMFVLRTRVKLWPHPWATWYSEDEDELLVTFEKALEREAGIHA
jgi:hypothetical protein